MIVEVEKEVIFSGLQEIFDTYTSLDATMKEMESRNKKVAEKANLIEKTISVLPCLHKKVQNI